MDTVDVPSFFEVKGRGGDPSTEELHSRTSQVKRFNSGQSYAWRNRRGAGSSPDPSSSVLLGNSSTLLDTETHAVVRAAIVPSGVAVAASSANRCTGTVTRHGWAFLFADGAVLAWEQGMVGAERAGPATSAAQSCLRFEHPTMMDELAVVANVEVSVEGVDLLALTEPCEASDGRRELLLVSPRGMARYWPDLHSPRRFTDIDARSVAAGQSVTRVTDLGSADFLCGLSGGNVLRIRPGLAQPCLLAQSSSYIGRGLSTFKLVGSYIGQKTFSSAEPPASAPNGTASAASPATPVVNLSVVNPPGGSPSSIPARIMRLTTETLEVWSVTRGEGGGSGTEALETRHALSSQVEGALGVRKACLLDLAIAGNTFGVSAEGEASPRWGVDLVVLVISTGEDGGGGGRGEENAVFSVHLVRVFSSGEASWARSAATVKLVSSHFVAGGPSIPYPDSTLPRAAIILDKEAFLSGDTRATIPRSWGGRNSDRRGGVGVHIVWPASITTRVSSLTVGFTAPDEVEWEGHGSVEVSDRVALLGGCIGSGSALPGCPGVMLLSAKGQAVWIAPHEVGGLAVDLESPEFSSEAIAEELRLALLDEGLSAFEGGQLMENAKFAVGSMLRQGSQNLFGDLDAAIIQAGIEVLNGKWRHPSAFTPPHQLVHLALREKSRRFRALVRFLLDAGVWGVARAARAALAEGGEKIAAAARLCELQDTISRNSIGVKAGGLLAECITLALRERAEKTGVTEAELSGVGGSDRDRYFEHTEGVLDALVELHLPRRNGVATSGGVGGGSAMTPLQRCLSDPSLRDGERLALLNQISLVVAGVFEAALRHRTSERRVYRSGKRGQPWTSSPEARDVLFHQLHAYDKLMDALREQESARGDSEVMRGVIGRLSVLILDGFKEEKQANPAASGQVDWQGEYNVVKALAVRVVASSGNETLARSIADTHGFYEGTVSLCHEAEMRQPKCRNGHQLLKSRMVAPPREKWGDAMVDVELSEAAQERKQFTNFVLDWHLRKGLKTALLDVGQVVPNILCQFLADWREAELLWIFQLRVKDYPGAGHALTRGVPPADQKGGKSEAQHLWLSLAKLAFLAGGDPASSDPGRGAEIQRRLELAEVRDRLMKFVPDDLAVSNDQWSWRDALTLAIESLSTYSTRAFEDKHDVADAADIAFQGYKAIVAGLSENSHEYVDELWREVIGVTLNDPYVRKALAKGAIPTASEDATVATDREMEDVWKRPTVLHLLLRAITKDRRRRRDAPLAGDVAFGQEERIDLTDESLAAMVQELMPAAADGNGATCETWITAIRKCPW